MPWHSGYVLIPRMFKHHAYVSWPFATIVGAALCTRPAPAQPASGSGSGWQGWGPGYDMGSGMMGGGMMGGAMGNYPVTSSRGG
jgi:hypothetical protein